jgi:MFS family permease
VTEVDAEGVVGADDAAAILRPRAALVKERQVGPGCFEQEEGPLRTYRRQVSTEPLDDGRVRVRQVVELSLGVPYFSWLFGLPVRRELGRLGPVDRSPWWAPPHRMTRRAAVVLATLAALAVVVGYLGSLLSLTMTYAAKEFGVGKTGQGVALGAVRINVILALVVLVLADRRGRRRIILLTALAGAVVTACGALAPSLVWLTAAQVVATSLVAALLILIGVMAAEEMPAGCRAWAVGLIGMATGLGSGLATMALPLAGLAPGGWRWLYVGALLALPLAASTARHLPESRRFSAPTAATPKPAHGATGRRRLLLIGGGAFLLALFATPSSQFQNEFLRTERAFSASRISLFSLVCGTIGGLGVLIGGRMADVRGRRAVAAVGVGAGIITTLAAYSSRGWPLWAWGIVDCFLGYAVGPALAIYGPELFPTSLRSRSAGLIAAVYALGGVVGLVATGVLSSHFGTLAPAFAVLAFGPALLVVLIVRAYPETANVELEDLNPTDRRSPAPANPATATAR